MPRNQVFISYSHNDKDQAFLKEFRVHLKPWETTEQLNVWSDRRIIPSQDWHQEIQNALNTTAVAVLLVSPDFLASEYIRNFELPLLLRAREEGQLDLACLYLRSSAVDDDNMAFEVILSSGEIVRVKLTKYQGLNSPGAVLNSQDPNKHDAIYLQAASDIKKLFTQRTRTATHSPTGKRYELTVQFKRNGNHLTRIYLHQYGRFPEYRSPWQGTGQALLDILFGSQEQCALSGRSRKRNLTGTDKVGA